MKPEIKDRINKINRGEVPEGYKKKGVNIIPVSWNEYRYKDIFKLANGVGLTQGDIVSGPYPVYGGNGVSGFHIKYNVEKGKIIIGRVGANCGSVYLTSEKAWVTDNALYIKEKLIEFDDKYMFYKLLFQKLNRYADRNAQPLISGTKIYEIKTYLPPIKEQQKIADILSTWDKAIELKEKLIEQKKEQKKGLMQRLLTGKVRLPGFKGEWKEVKLGDIIKECKEQTTKNNEYPVLTSSRKGLFLQEDYFSKQVASDDNTGYKIVRKGDFTYRTMSDDGDFVFNQLENYEIGIVSPAYAVFRPTRVNSIYLRNLLNSYTFKKYIKKVVQGGTRLSFRFNDLKEIKVLIPSLEEQNAIGDILLKAEEQIALMEQELFELKQQKKGLMQLLLTGKVRVKC